MTYRHDELRHLIGADLIPCLENLATNQVTTDEVVYILSPHACRTKRQWHELAEQCTKILLPSVTAHFANSMSVEHASHIAAVSIESVMDDLVQRDLIMQPNAVIDPKAPSINHAGLVHGAYSTCPWFHIPESDGLPADNIPASTKLTLQEAGRLESIAAYCHLFQENKSILGFLGMLIYTQQYTQDKVKELLQQGPSQSLKALPE